MTVRQRTDKRGRIVRTVTVSGLEAAVVDLVGSWTNVQVTEPEQQEARADVSPRQLAAWKIGWADGYKGFPGTLGPGGRIEIAQIGVLELLGSPRALQTNRAITGWEVRAQLLGTLYPITAEWQQQGGAPIEPIPVAMWNETERQERQGRYEDFSAEVPVEFNVAVGNQLVVNGRIFRVGGSTLELGEPRRVLDLRSASSG